MNEGRNNSNNADSASHGEQILYDSCRIIKKNQFRMDSKPFIVGGRDGEELSEPDITVHKDKDFITGIEVKCVCGRVINIDCK